MVALMQHVVRLDESSSFTSEQKIAQLESENRTLRELLSVSKQFASSVRPAAASNPFSPSVGSSNASPDLASPVGSNTSTDDFLEGRSSSFSSDNGSAASANYNLVSTVKKRPLPAGETESSSSRPQNISQSDSGLFNGVKLNGSGPDVKTESPTANSLTGNNSNNSGFGLVNGSVNFTLSSTSNNNNYQFINNDDPKSGAASYECLRNGPNKVLVVSAPLDGNNSTFNVGSDSSASDMNMVNNHSSGGNHEGYMIYRQPSDNDIVSDTDSDSSSSNASTVTLTPCTSDREDDEPCPMVPDSLMISSPPQDVVAAAAVTPFKTVPNCLTNGCIGDYHSTSTAAPSQLSLDDETTTTPVMASAANLTNGIP